MVQRAALERVLTGVPGLDSILGGGLLPGGLYMVQGPPGAGKTILAAHLAFNQTATGNRAAFVTLLSESHDRLLQYLQPLTFFREEHIGDRLVFLSGHQAIVDGEVESLLQLLVNAIKQQAATFLVVDEISTAYALCRDALTFRRFLHRLQAFMQAYRCTGVLLTTGRAVERDFLAPVVDGFVELKRVTSGLREARALRAGKSRGGLHLEGWHYYRITGDGVAVYPRTELVHGMTRAPLGDEPPIRMPTGLARLDAMLRGGLSPGTVLLVVGPTGSGKTLLSLSFALAGREPSVYVGFYESPPELIRKARRVGLLAAQETAEAVKILWQPPQEGLIDVVAERTIEAVDRVAARRVIVDGLGGLQAMALFPSRLGRFLSALMNELRNRGAAVVFTAEPAELTLFGHARTGSGLSVVADSVLNLRYVHARGELRRLLSILKVRDSDYETAVHEFQITNDGITVAESPISAATLLGNRVTSPWHDAEDRPAT